MLPASYLVYVRGWEVMMFGLKRGDLVMVQAGKGRQYRGLILEKRPMGWMVQIPGGTGLGLNKLLAHRENIWKI